MKKVKREVEKSVFSVMNTEGQQKVIVAISMSDAFNQCHSTMGRPLYGKALDITVDDYYKQKAAHDKAHNTTTIMVISLVVLMAISIIFGLIMITK